MTERTVKVRLSAQVQEYISGMEKAAQATRETGSEGERLTQQKQAFQQLGTAMVAVGGSITAVGVAALKAGVSYNTLQQTSRAALKTMLGSTQAVNEQMGKLDEFARESPFAKDMFISAQQNMLAFGIETQKVIPYLDALQNAVAASGGSNQDIAELAEIFGKIQASAKITAVDLMQFGRRGIDAAVLIGTAMGKTGAEIREEITAGTLDAGQALDALAEGMSEKFAGAAANVKDTFAGAMDRVRAAWRDFGAEFAKPLVDPEGGGVLVDFLNGLADAMRAFEKLPEPLKQTVTWLGLAGGAAIALGGSFLIALPKWVEFRNALANTNALAHLRDGLGGIVRFLGGPWGAAMIAAAASYAILSKQIKEGHASQVEIAAALKTSADEAAGLEAAFQMSSLEEWAMGGDTITDYLNDLSGVLERTHGVANNFFSHAWNFTWNGDIAVLDTLERFSDGLVKLSEDDLPLAADRFRGLAESQNLTRDETAELLEKMPSFKESLEEVAYSSDLAADDTTLLALAMGEIGPTSREASEGVDAQAEALEMLKGKASETEDKLDELADTIRGFGSAVLSTREANRALEDAFDTLATSMENNGTTLDINSAKGRENEAAIDAVAKKALEAAASTYEQTGSQEKANAVLAAGRDRLIEMISPFFESKDAAAKYVDQLELIPENIDSSVKIIGYEQAMAEAANIRDAINSIPGYKEAHINMLQSTTNIPRGQLGAAYNNMGGFYQDGVEYFANGGIPVGMYRGGRTLYGFAEEDVPWEAFISGKPAAKERSKQIWAETGDRLGIFEDLAKAITQSGTSGKAVSIGNVNFTGNAGERQVIRDLEDAIARVERG